MSRPELPEATIFAAVSEDIDAYLTQHGVDPTQKIPDEHQEAMLDKLTEAEQGLSYLEEGSLFWAHAPTVFYSEGNYERMGTVIPVEDATVRGVFHEFMLTTFSGPGPDCRQLTVMALLRGWVTAEGRISRGYIQVPLTTELQISYCAPEEMN